MPEISVIGRGTQTIPISCSKEELIEEKTPTPINKGETLQSSSAPEALQARPSASRSGFSKTFLRLAQTAAVVVAAMLTAAAGTESAKPENGNDQAPQTTQTQNRFTPRLVRSGARQPLFVESSFTPTQLAKYYNFPRGTDGEGQTIAILEFGGGYNQADLKAYFQKLGVPMPQVIWVSVDGAKNNPHGLDWLGRHYNEDIEVTMDIQIAGAVAPKAKIVVYFAPNTDDGFADAIRAATWDRSNRPTIMSISWGLSEADSKAAGLRKANQAFREAAIRGITIFVSSGDNGSIDASRDGKDHVDFPAASPWVIGCGGTSLVTDDKGKITNEVVWNNNTDLMKAAVLGVGIGNHGGIGQLSLFPLWLRDGGGATGGGVSEVFALPPWQRGVGVPNPEGDWWRGRGVPDVAANADPYSGYAVRVNGQDIVVGGTSAVSPLWAGLTARINQGLDVPSVGYINPIIYAKSFKDGFRDVVEGDNGAYKAIAGWDPTTGLGSPNGENLLGAFRSYYAGIGTGTGLLGAQAQANPENLFFTLTTSSPWERQWPSQAFPNIAIDMLPLRKSG